MFFAFHAAPHFYAGLSGGITHIKRKLTLDKDFKDADLETDNVKMHFSVSLHLGLTTPVKEKFFVGLEGFAGRAFGEDYFKPQINFGAKAIAGFNVNEKLRIYAGAGADFMRIKSLKIGLDGEKYELCKFPTKRSDPYEPLNYQMFPLFLGNVGAEFFIMKKLSLRLDGQFLIGGNKNFNKTKIKDSNPTQILDISSEKYRTFKAIFGLFYHGEF